MLTQFLKSFVAANLLALSLASSAQAQQNIDVSLNDGLLSVRTSNASAIALAEALSQELGISVVVTGDTDKPISVDIVDEPLEKALGKLSPNNMLIRSGQAANDSIIEVVLMMGDDTGNGSYGSEQFLPSGSPADEIIEENQQDINPPIDDLQPQIEPDYTGDGSNNAEQPAEEQNETPAPKAFDPATGLALDPDTGLPLDPESGLPVEQ